MQEIVFQGLKISTPCCYLKFTLGRWLKITEDFERSLFEVVFPNNFKSSDLIDYRITLVAEKKLVQTDYIKLGTPEFNLNGLKFKKLVQKDYLFSQIIVSDSEEFTMNYEEDRCTILIPKKLVYDIEKYIALLKYNPFIEIVDYSKLKSLNNFYSINFSKKPFTINSSNEFAFGTKKKYQKYILNTEDVLLSFKLQLEGILKEFGVNLLEYPIAKNLNSRNHIVYRFTELGSQLSRKTIDENTLRYATQQKATVEFDASFPDIIILTDFKNKYQNLDLVSNFTEFYTKDSLGNDWLSNVKWNQISSEFEQDFTQDNVGNIAFRVTFNAEIYYYIVRDELFNTINKIVVNLLSCDTNNNTHAQDTFIKKLK